MSEAKEGQGLGQENKESIRIKVPERLAVGQNLYDQEPFQSIGENICGLSGETLDVIRHNISYLAKDHFRLIAEDPKAQTTDLLKRVDLIPRAFRIPGGHRVDLIEALHRYPYWSEYIMLQRQKHNLYGPSGKFIQSHNARNDKLPLSYANWITHKKNSWLVGIDEIFPSQVGHPATSLPNVTGVNPATRRFRILRASDISKEK